LQRSSIEQLAIELGVAMGVAQHAAQQPDLEVAQRAGRPPLGLADVAQQRDGRSAPRRLERGEQRLGE